MGPTNKSAVTIVAIILLVLVLIGSCLQQGTDNPKQTTFARLDEIRDQEKESISKHFQSLAQTAGNIVHDQLMLESFHRLQSSGPSSQENRSLDPGQSHTLDSHFVHSYGSFYDLLFVEKGGFVFHSIKQESDYHTQLFSGPLSQTRLASQLAAEPGIKFVDFEKYGPSGEAAAFFVEQVMVAGQIQGWFILQYGSNELNAMLANREKLGGTGEVYLVNHDRLMLSDSRFVNDSTVLELANFTAPVKSAFESGPGHAIARDYRDVQVFSSFDTLDFFHVTWAIIVEIDVDEVASSFFLENLTDLSAELVRQAGEDCQAHQTEGNLSGPLPTSSRVDVNEFRRVNNGEICWSPGVGPCTAVIAYYPERFGYLLHLGPTDDVYTGDPLTRIVLGTRRTDLLNDLQNRIARFDLVDSEMGRMKYVVVATHTNSLEGILESLLDRGVGLSQIQFAHDPDADYANVRFNQANDEVLVQWVNLDSAGPTRITNTKGLPNLSAAIDILESN